MLSHTESGLRILMYNWFGEHDRIRFPISSDVHNTAIRVGPYPAAVRRALSGLADVYRRRSHLVSSNTQSIADQQLDGWMRSLKLFGQC